MSYIVIVNNKVVYKSDHLSGCRGFIDAYGEGEIAKVLSKAQGSGVHNTFSTKLQKPKKR